MPPSSGGAVLAVAHSLPSRRDRYDIGPGLDPVIDTLRAAKLAAQARLADARRELSSAQSEFQKASKAERAAVFAFIEAYDNAAGGRHG
jgi:hypothetical protein